MDKKPARRVTLGSIAPGDAIGPDANSSFEVLRETAKAYLFAFHLPGAFENHEEVWIPKSLISLEPTACGNWNCLTVPAWFASRENLYRLGLVY